MLNKTEQHENSINIIQIEKNLNPENKIHELYPSDYKKPFIGESDVYTHMKLKLTSKEEESLALWKKGQALIEAEQITQAIVLLKRCIELNPSIQDEFIGLGCLQDRIGYHYGSLSEWISLMKTQYSKQSSPYDLLSLCLSISKNYLEHKHWYTRMLCDNPQNVKLMFGLANLQYNNKTFELAEKQYKRVIELAPDLEQPYLKISFIHCLKWNNDTEAIESAKEALKYRQNDYYALLILALCNKDLQERIESLKKLAQLVPNYGRTYNGLGNAFYNKKEFTNAISSYKKCIEVNDRYEHPYYGLGSIYNQLGDFDESIKWYKLCIKVSPDYDYPHYGLGIVYNNKNDTQNAIFWFKECIRVNPNYDCSYYALGNIYRLAKNYREAIKYYEQSLQLKPIDPLCFINIALGLLNIEQQQKALGYFQQARKHLAEDKMLSLSNIEYIKDQLQRYLQEGQKHEHSCLGFITLKQKIKARKLICTFKVSYQGLYEQGDPTNCE